MNSTFPARLTALRKSKKISQKEAAQQLGISQSLLSHYEKGIRECGLDFLCNAAKYYGVSADYLLGLTDIPGLQETLTAPNDDSVLSPRTVCRAAHALISALEIRPNTSATLMELASFSVYKVLLKAVELGVLPKGWSKYKILIGKRASAYVCSRLEHYLIMDAKDPEESAVVAQLGPEAPQALQTLEQGVVDLMEQQANHLLKELAASSATM